MPPLEAVKVLVSIMTSVGWSSKRETFEVETTRRQQSAFSRNSPETHVCPSSSGRSTEMFHDESGERGQERLSGLGCVGARAGELTGLVGQESGVRVDAVDWLNKNQLADLKSYGRATV